MFSYIFLKENVWISIKISLKFVPKGPIDNIPALIQMMAWCLPGDKPLTSPMMISLPTHICVTQLMQYYISFSVCRRNKDPPPVPMDFAKPASPVTADVELATLRDLPDSGTTHLNALYAIKWVINSLWPSDTIWWPRSGSTLAQVMACCLMAPSHYLNQSWLIIREVQWHSYQGNFTRNASTINH